MQRNLLLIVIVQSIVLAVVLIWRRRRSGDATLNWIAAIAVGAVFGLAMDLSLGAQDVFAYHPLAGQPLAVQPRRLPMLLLIFNAIASYGIASVTAAAVAPRLVTLSRPGTGWALVLALAAIAGIGGVLLLPNGSLAILFAWGVVLIASGELALWGRAKSGPFLSLAAVRDWHPLSRLVRLSLLVGLSYELANAAFPFWVWLPGSSLGPIGLAALIALIGYVALLHPLTVLYLLVTDAHRGSHGNARP